MKLHLSEKERYIIEHAKHTFNYVFQILLILFLLTLLVQQFYPDFVNSKININWFMIVVIVFGALSIIFPVTHKKEDKPATKKDLFLVISLGILGAIIIFLKLRNLGWISYVISALGGLIIILLSWMILTEKDGEEK